MKFGMTNNPVITSLFRHMFSQGMTQEYENGLFQEVVENPPLHMKFQWSIGYSKVRPLNSE